jgi:aminopeptidase YwaD
MKKNHLFLILFVFCVNFGWAQITNKEVLHAHVSYLASEELEGRGLGTEGKDLAKTYIKSQFEAAGLIAMGESYAQDFPLKMSMAWVKATNIVGMVEGTDPQLKNEYIVIGAHYDHMGYELKKDQKIIYPGADDNASGVAAVIELAKHFNKPENKPKRSIIFIAFDAEESGLLGSKHYVKTIDEELRKNIKVMFSFDMVGMLEANKGLDLKGMGTLSSGVVTAERHAQGISLLNLSANIESRTDTEPFGDAGIPAIHVFTGLKSPYHKPEDKADLLDYHGMTKVVEYMAKVVADLSSQPVLEPISSMKSSSMGEEKVISKRLQGGVILNLGNGRHMYRDEFFDAKHAFSYEAGLRVNYKLSRVTHLNLEALYGQNTSRSAAGTFKRESITVPLNFEFGNPTYSGKKERFFFFGGPYFRYNLSGKDGGVDLDFEDIYSETEWGLNFGFGFNINKLRFAFTHRSALESIFQEGNNVRANVGYLTIGYNF